ncbi:spore germination protein PC [Cytobacillus firmus]|uniref:Spore germination protein PC n=2 Tax=Cytobacillus TaxID=2675230 RepID=A0A366JUR2_CYTFI|nr:spore germination protein GerPC [Cytobacillus oceanisediminis]RBP92264.1 spore germination protein PC [Cytobacillus firmus]TDX42051.1 spore germination protein PC [Cytobacillus oceanisediminis]
MNQQLNTYLQQLHAFVEAQEKRIRSLEAAVRKLQEENEVLKSRPPMQVDRIEYKFDQLKVESLEGTLNIGLNPSELQNIEDFAVDNKNINAPISPKNQMKRTMEIEDAIYQYLERELPEITSSVQKKLNVSVDDSYIAFIKEDIKKQLPNRIDFYIKQQASNRSGQENDNAEIIELIKKEIHNGVHAFISHLPENMKGMNNE